MGIMEKKMETTIYNRVYIEVILNNVLEAGLC